jgi:hypothetical protein
MLSLGVLATRLVVKAGVGVVGALDKAGKKNAIKSNIILLFS